MTEFIVYIGNPGSPDLEATVTMPRGTIHRHIVQAVTPYDAAKLVLQSKCAVVTRGVTIEVFQASESMQFQSDFEPLWMNG